MRCDVVLQRERDVVVFGVGVLELLADWSVCGGDEQPGGEVRRGVGEGGRERKQCELKALFV